MIASEVVCRIEHFEDHPNVLVGLKGLIETAQQLHSEERTITLLSVPLECKATLSAKNSHFSGLKQYLDVFGLHFGILVSAAPFRVIRSGKNALVNLPLYLASGHKILRALLSDLFECLDRFSHHRNPPKSES